MEIQKNEIVYPETEVEDEETTEVDLKDLIAQNMILSLEIDNLENAKLDEKRFQNGLKDISYVCGMITGLVNIGVTAVDALAYVMAEHTLENNIELNKIANDGELLKLQSQKNQAEKQSL